MIGTVVIQEAAGNVYGNRHRTFQDNPALRTHYGHHTATTPVTSFNLADHYIFTSDTSRIRRLLCRRVMR